MKNISKFAIYCLFTIMTVCLIELPAFAGSARVINQKVEVAMEALLASSPAAKEMAKIAKGVLVFPDIVKGGLIVGGQYGEGALIVDGKVVAHYNTVAASYGLQIGAQSFGYAMFFMTDSSLQYLKKSSGWEIGVGPSVVAVDKGLARTLTTSTAKADIYAFCFGQKGLMAGLGLQGSKITKINPGK